MRDFNNFDDDEYQNEIDNFWQNNDDDDDDDEDEDEEYDEDEMELMGYTKKDLMRAVELELVENELDLKLLGLTIRSLEKSIWWRFRRYETRLSMIAKTYLIFSKLMLNKREKDREEKEKGR